MGTELILNRFHGRQGELRVKQGGLALLVSGAHALEGWELPLFFEIFTSTRGV